MYTFVPFMISVSLEFTCDTPEQAMAVAYDLSLKLERPITIYHDGIEFCDVRAYK